MRVGQAEAAYRAILRRPRSRREGSFASVVSETLFLRSLGADLEPVRAARQSGARGPARRRSHRPATTEIEQPPLR